MTASDNLHSQVVGWAKVLLPLAALVLLSTLFLFARKNEEAESIPYAEITALAREQVITNPSFSGVSDTGAVIQIRADAARPDLEMPTRVTIDAPRLMLDAADGTSLRVNAGAGMIDSAAGIAQMTGLARLITSNGYTMESSGLDADLETGTVTSHGQMAIQAPFGQLTAGQVVIHWAESGEGQQLQFTQGVKLVYEPPQADAERGEE